MPYLKPDTRLSSVRIGEFVAGLDLEHTGQVLTDIAGWDVKPGDMPGIIRSREAAGLLAGLSEDNLELARRFIRNALTAKQGALSDGLLKVGGLL
jgi:hypothetical protein